ncbi:MAG: DUF2062 domain-containing protein [Sphingomonadaceae bacterium]|uniref:DUF2062 domain-containing protein n=1 Tax=Thermaurantiacus sp. TaxID=2820283 RepID=UPI00298F297A|nr:DUF2062 domain-containing protein [Thermaurantiacus sp.]MCS6986470.1 DUF2062 domain-containing protein [Sphingomonadaceae bacterium]MDW8414269.1 DUF2062 domain-containing protein [Thermaurantiacus sp.]
MDWLKRRLPTREALEANRFLRPFAHRLSSPLVWRFNRRGVARGIALGLFAAFAVPIAQTPFAAAFALGLRANLPVAALSTLVTNPITFPPVYVLAYQTGRFLLELPDNDTRSTAMGGVLGRFVETVGTTYLGLILFAVVAATLGYLGTVAAWRLWVSRRWHRRLALRRRGGRAGFASPS